MYIGSATPSWPSSRTFGRRERHICEGEPGGVDCNGGRHVGTWSLEEPTLASVSVAPSSLESWLCAPDSLDTVLQGACESSAGSWWRRDGRKLIASWKMKRMERREGTWVVFWSSLPFLFISIHLLCLRILNMKASGHAVCPVIRP